MSTKKLDGRKTHAQRVEALLKQKGGKLTRENWLRLTRGSSQDQEGLAILVSEGKAFVQRDENDRPIMIGLSKS